jgi:CheY-like chemotaxis protein
LLVQLLQSVGFEVQAATNGQEAIALWETWQPHLIWMDMRMPVMDGYEATQRIRAREPETSFMPTKIIALTASAFEEDRSRVLGAGCNDFVRKPFQETELLEKMAEHLAVQYLYQETDQTESAICTKISFDVVAALRTVPAPLLAQLYQATIQLDSNQLVLLIEQIAPDQPALAHLLTEKLDNFDLEYILNLLQGIL